MKYNCHNIIVIIKEKKKRKKEDTYRVYRICRYAIWIYCVFIKRLHLKIDPFTKEFLNFSVLISSLNFSFGED